MMKLVAVLLGFMVFSLASYAEAADSAAAEQELPSLVMLSTPT